MRASIALTGLLLTLGLTAAPTVAHAQDPKPKEQVSKQDPTGSFIEAVGVVKRVSGGLQLCTKTRQAYTLTGDVDALAPLTGRTITVEGEVGGKPQIETDGTIVRELEVLRVINPRKELVRGVLSNSGKLVTPAGRAIRLSGAPSNLLARLEGRRLVVRGWLFKGDELCLTSVEARVKKDGWLSTRRRHPTTGKWQYKTTAEVSVGQPLRVTRLAAYNKKTKTWKPVSQLTKQDILFVEAQLGRPRPGEQPLAGWIPAYKLEFGEKVAQTKPQTDPKPKPKTDQTPKTAESRGAAGVLSGQKPTKAKTPVKANPWLSGLKDWLGKMKARLKKLIERGAHEAEQKPTPKEPKKPELGDYPLPSRTEVPA